MSEKIYCTHCGTHLPAGTEICTHCHRKPYGNNSPFREFLIRHTKDKLKGTVEDKIYDTLKNYLLSHLYGTLVTLSIGAVVVSAAATTPAPKPERISERPDSVSTMLLHSQEAIATLPAEETEATETETTLPEVNETEPVGPQPIVYDFDSQAEIMLANYSLWEKPTEYAMYQSYFVTDLDQDGLLEISSTATAGSGIFSNLLIYEVSESMDGLVLISAPSESDPDIFYTIDSSRWDLTNTCIGYYDPETGVYSYIVRDSWRSGAANSGAVYSVLTMVDNNISLETIGTYEYAFDMATQRETNVYTIDGVTYTDDEAFHEALCTKFANCVKFTYDMTMLDSYAVTDINAQIRSLVAGYYLTLQDPA